MEEIKGSEWNESNNHKLQPIVMAVLTRHTLQVGVDERAEVF